MRPAHTLYEVRADDLIRFQCATKKPLFVLAPSMTPPLQAARKWDETKRMGRYDEERRDDAIYARVAEYRSTTGAKRIGRVGLIREAR
jgi:hypothetical protein